MHRPCAAKKGDVISAVKVRLLKIFCRKVFEKRNGIVGFGDVDQFQHKRPVIKIQIGKNLFHQKGRIAPAKGGGNPLRLGLKQHMRTIDRGQDQKRLFGVACCLHKGNRPGQLNRSCAHGVVGGFASVGF